MAYYSRGKAQIQDDLSVRFRDRKNKLNLIADMMLSRGGDQGDSSP